MRLMARPSLRYALDLTQARRLQLAEPVARRLLGILIALPLVLGLQARPFVRVDRLHIGSLVLAVGRRLRRKQRRIGPANAQFGMLPCLNLDAGMHGCANVRCRDLSRSQTEFTVRGFARASTQPDRKNKDRHGQRFWT